MWLSHLRPSGRHSVKRPAAQALPESLRRGLVDAGPGPLRLAGSEGTPRTFRDVWIDKDTTPGVCVVHFDFYNGVMRQEQGEALAALLRGPEVAGDPSVKAVMLTGGVTLFLSGIDLNELEQPNRSQIMRRERATASVRAFSDVALAVAEMDKVTVAAVGGSADGGGAWLSQACDVVLARDNIVFRLPRHYHMAGSSMFFGERVGHERMDVALEAMSAMLPMSADKACEYGFVNEVLTEDVSKADFNVLAAQYAAELDHSTLTEAKRGRRDAAFWKRAEAAFASEEYTLVELMSSSQFMEESSHNVRRFRPLVTPFAIVKDAAARHGAGTGRVLDGNAVSKTTLAHMAARLRVAPSAPGLGIVLGTSRQDSATFSKVKQRACAEIGMHSELVSVDETAADAEKQLLHSVARLNSDPKIHGIIVQLPLPPHVDAARVLAAIAPEKDVDGLSAASVGMLAQHGADAARDPHAGFLAPCAASSVLAILDHYGVSVAGRACAVVGTGNLVGTPVALALMHRHARVTTCDALEPDVASVVGAADVVVAAVGQAGAVSPAWLKRGAVVIDTGANVDEAGQPVGDVAPGIEAVASYCTPVPGGFGPVIVASLLHNTFIAWPARRFLRGK